MADRTLLWDASLAEAGLCRYLQIRASGLCNGCDLARFPSCYQLVFLLTISSPCSTCPRMRAERKLLSHCHIVTLSLALSIWLWLGCDTRMRWSCMYYSAPSIDPNKMVSAQFSLQLWVPTSTAWGMKSLGLGEESWGKSHCQYSLHSRQFSHWILNFILPKNLNISTMNEILLLISKA